LKFDAVSGNLDYRIYQNSEDNLFLFYYSNYTCKKSIKLF